MPSPRFPAWLLSALRLLLVLAASILLAHWPPLQRFYARHSPTLGARGWRTPASPQAAQIVAAARGQIGTIYDASYQPLPYPGGDVPADRGACSDVVVRALRGAGFDLQQLIHEDILSAPETYPAPARGERFPDPNIDHRRAKNQMRFFARHGLALTTEATATTLGDWQPGDLVYWEVLGARQHTGVLSDRVNRHGLPLVIHNGSVCMEQDCLTDEKIIGHYRYPARPQPPLPRHAAAR